MDAYGGLSVDDLLDLPNDDFFSSSSSSSAAVSDFLLHHPNSSAANVNAHFQESSIPTYSTDLTDIFHVPTEEAAELEWLSNYMDDSFTDFPANELTSASVNFHSINAKGFHGRARSKRSRPPSTSAAGENQTPSLKSEENADVARRCTHCASEKTPQWRTGPLGPKTLCNACGVRYKSGRLVPEYRPAASPTFVLTQHSNSHRKVLELRRQKEVVRQQQQQQEAYGRHFRVC
ncbi:GATA transcription factor 4 [Perilla frutescens var. hirtella]|uniref:GATA transcription factor n=1 Tax=Perilla frutescens var. hirtella TaxID=608512 RepID=A0AAD4J232_PERFH|nr:GATA transcription factor 4 [Perilla frutescens var. hirtella]